MKPAALVVIFVSPLCATASGQRRIISVQNVPTASGTLQVGVAPLGSSVVSPLLAGWVSAGANPYTIRDSVMPAAGIAGIGKRSTLVTPGWQMFHSEAFQYWASEDGSSWSVLPEAEDILFFGLRVMDGYYAASSSALETSKRTILTYGNATSAATFHLGTAPVGSASVTNLLSGNLATNEAASPSLRDRMMPPEGIPSLGKRGLGGIRVFAADTIQFWVSTDGSNWTLVGGPSDPELIVNGVRFLDLGNNGSAAVGNVPAISTWGLLVLGLGVVAAASLVIRRHLAPTPIA